MAVHPGNALPVEVADYALVHGLEAEPAFVWWVLKWRNRIIAAVIKQYHKRTHKFGIEIPKTYDDCVLIDNENGSTLWQDLIRKEMSKVRVAFKTLGNDEPPPPTFQDEMRCHIVYDVKMENFQRRACLVAGGHMTKVSSHMPVSSARNQSGLH